MAENLRGVVHVRMAENVSLEVVQSVVANIVGLTGCRGCGLVGIDLRLSGDPVEAQRVEQLEKLQGVKSVSFGG